MSRFLWAAAVLALAPSAALAQSARNAANEVDGVIVTAPLDRARSDIAQGVTVLNQEQVLAAPIGGLGETLESQPGVSSSYFGAGASRPIIRGLGEDRVRILSNGVGVVDASAISPDHAVTAEGLEAERIEVLRGPAALAYGGNAVGGVVNVIDGLIAEEAPDQSFSAQAYAGLAEGLNSAAAAGAVRVAQGPFVLRVEGFTRDAGDFEIPGYADAHALEEIEEGHDPAEFAYGEAPNSFSEAQGGALGLSLVGESGLVGVSVRRFDSLYGIPEGSHKHEEEEEEEEGPALFAGPRIDMEQTRVDFRAGLDRPIGIFERTHFSGAIVDYTHSEIEETGEVGTVFTNEGWEARLETHHRAFENVLGGTLTGALGVSAFSKDFAAEGDEAFISPTTTEEQGIFLVESLDFGRFALEGGLRFDSRSLDNDVFGDRSFDLLSGSASLAYRPVQGLFFGLTLARTERAPTETELFAFGPHLATQAFEVGDPALTEEIATTAELAARYRADRWHVEASVYRAEFEDYIALVATGEEEDELPVFAFTQRDATFTGGEVEIGADLFTIAGLDISADAAFDWVRAEFDEGGDLPRIPPRTLTLGLNAENGFVRGRIEWQDVAEQDDVAEFETVTPGYQMWNAQLTFRPVADNDRLAFLIDARNLTDEEARVHTSFVKDLLPRPGRSIRFAILSRF
ncbi:MAG: TonB-dependent receptor [Hyphomonadaceae bacterium]